MQRSINEKMEHPIIYAMFFQQLRNSSRAKMRYQNWSPIECTRARNAVFKTLFDAHTRQTSLNLRSAEHSKMAPISRCALSDNANRNEICIWMRAARIHGAMAQSPHNPFPHVPPICSNEGIPREDCHRAFAHVH